MNVAAILKEKGPHVVTGGPDMRLIDVAKALAARKIGAIVIVEGGERIAGIVSERDIVRAIANGEAAVMNETVEGFMTHEVVTCKPSDTIDDLMSRMTSGKFRHLPVVEGGKLAGIVSIGDIVKHRIAETELEAESLRHYIAAG